FYRKANMSWGSVIPHGRDDITIASKVVHENQQPRDCVTHEAHSSVSEDGSRLDMKRATSSAWRFQSEAQRSQPPTIVQNNGGLKLDSIHFVYGEVSNHRIPLISHLASQPYFQGALDKSKAAPPSEEETKDIRVGKIT
ncbi:hypothetical protein GW17_00049978, partial [Ensete ventricosum]